MNIIKVSIVVPIYNVEKYLEKCLESILMQSLKEVEIICINDGSTDNSKKILESYKDKFLYLKVINQKNKGLSYSRNRGVKLSKGKYVYFLDSDDFLKNKNSLEFMYNIAEKNELDLLINDFENYYEGTEKIEKENLITLDKSGKIYKGIEILNYGLKNKKNFSISVNRLMKRRIIEKEKLYFIENIYYEDVEYNIRSLFFFEKVMYNPEVTMVYRRRSNSITTAKIGEKNIKSYYIVAIKIQNFLKERKKDDAKLSYQQAAICLYKACIEVLKNRKLVLPFERTDSKEIMDIILSSPLKYKVIIILIILIKCLERKRRIYDKNI